MFRHFVACEHRRISGCRLSPPFSEIRLRSQARHFDEEIIIEYYECIDYKQKVDVLCLDLISNGSESICRSLWSFRRCVVPKDDN